MARKTFRELSPAYKKRLKRKGITSQRALERARKSGKLQRARGHIGQEHVQRMRYQIREGLPTENDKARIRRQIRSSFPAEKQRAEIRRIFDQLTGPDRKVFDAALRDRITLRQEAKRPGFAGIGTKAFIQLYDDYAELDLPEFFFYYHGD